MLKYNNIEIYEIRKIHIINILQKITLKMGLFGGLWNSIFAPIFQKSAKFSAGRVRKRGEKGSKQAIFWVAKTRKCNFISLNINKLNKKVQKNKKSAQGVMCVMEKYYFCNPKRRRYGTNEAKGLSTGECSLKE
jgi:hypothetical protein